MAGVEGLAAVGGKRVTVEEGKRVAVAGSESNYLSVGCGLGLAMTGGH